MRLVSDTLYMRELISEFLNTVYMRIFSEARFTINDLFKHYLIKFPPFNQHVFIEELGHGMLVLQTVKNETRH